VIYAKLLFGGFGRRGLEAITAAVILALTNALVASGLMIITGSYDAMSRAERDDRPDIIRVKAVANRSRRCGIFRSAWLRANSLCCWVHQARGRQHSST
jgi:hypothetical protein